MLRSLSLFVALALAGCASGEADAPEAAAPGEVAVAPQAPTGDHGSDVLAEPTSYTCADGTTFTVAPASGGAVQVTLAGETKVLQPAVDKTGVYGDGSLEVWIAAEGAFVVQDGEFTLTDCREAADA